jgi:hypothetical protein
MSSRGIGGLYETPNSIVGMGYIAVFIQPETSYQFSKLHLCSNKYS